jgi:hypothetical protein
MAFEIGPRQQEREYDSPAWRNIPAHRAQVHSRVINGTRYAFGRFTYDNGVVAVQVIKPGTGRGDMHYFTNSPN